MVGHKGALPGFVSHESILRQSIQSPLNRVGGCAMFTLKLHPSGQSVTRPPGAANDLATNASSDFQLFYSGFWH